MSPMCLDMVHNFPSATTGRCQVKSTQMFRSVGNQFRSDIIARDESGALPLDPSTRLGFKI